MDNVLLIFKTLGWLKSQLRIKELEKRVDQLEEVLIEHGWLSGTPGYDQ